MNTRIAEKSDMEILSQHDKHISKEELESVISLGRIIMAEGFTHTLCNSLFFAEHNKLP